MHCEACVLDLFLEARFLTTYSASRFELFPSFPPVQVQLLLKHLPFCNECHTFFSQGDVWQCLVTLLCSCQLCPFSISCLDINIYSLNKCFRIWYKAYSLTIHLRDNNKVSITTLSLSVITLGTHAQRGYGSWICLSVCTRESETSGQTLQRYHIIYLDT